nr:reverse transcriptase domain-containing protein [Tanacetum cinerariifolium]
MTRKPSISRRNRINWHYVRDDAMFSTIKVAAPKLKASARKKKGDSASSTTPPTPTPTTTVESALRLSATAKGKQPARTITPTEPTDIQRTEAEQLKITLKRSRQETHISQQHGSGTDEETGSKPGVLDISSNDSEEELSWNSSDDEEVGEQTKEREESEGDKSDESDEGSDDDSDETVKAGSEKDKDDDDNDDDDDDDEEENLAKNDEEDTETGKGGDEVKESEGESNEEETRQKEEGNFDPIPRTPKGSEEESNDEEDQELRLTFCFDERLRSLETSFSEYRQTNPFFDAVSAIPGIVHQYMTQQMMEAVREAVQIQTDRLQDSLQRENDEFLRNIDENNQGVSQKSADLSKMELKKILIEKMEGNKSIQRSDEQRNLYKALVEAYDADKAILDTYGDSTILKRRREDDDQEGPSAGSNRRSDAGVESIFTTESSPIVSLQAPTPIMTPSTIATITTSGDAPIPPTTIPSIILENLPTFNSAFRFDERLRLLETTFSEYRQTNPFVDVVSVIPDEGDKHDESDDGNDDDNDETIKAGSESDKDDDDNDDEEEPTKNDDEDTESGKGGDEVSESEGESDKEETRQEEEESFDPIPRTPKGSEDESNDEEDKELRLSEEARIQEEEEADELIKVNGVTDDALCLYLFPHFLTHHATAWFDRLPRNSINTFEQMVKMFLGKYFPPSMVTKFRNEITNFRQHPDESLFEAWECYMLSIDRCPNHNILPINQIDTFYNGLILRHRDTINAATDEVIKSSVEDLVLIPSESEGIPENMCDVPFSNNSSPLDISKYQFEDFSDSNDDSTSIDDDYFSIDDIDYVEETDTFDNSLPESEIFYFDLEEKRSGNPTSHTDLSLLDYEAFFCDSEPDSRDFTMDVVETIFDNPTREPRVHMPNVLPTHPTFHLDPDFTLFSDSLGSNLVVSFPSGNKNKIFNLGILIETLLPFSSKNKEQVFNLGILSSNLLSHRGKITSDFSENPMMISGGDIPFLDVPFLHFYLQ